MALHLVVRASFLLMLLFGIQAQHLRGSDQQLSAQQHSAPQESDLMLPSPLELAQGQRKLGECSATILCPNGQCCSQWGWCGTSADYCAAGCVSQCTGTAPAPAPAPPSGTLPVSNDGTCGGSLRCPTGQCCSQHGHCGTTIDYCGTGCQAAYGICAASLAAPAYSCTTQINATMKPSPGVTYVGTEQYVESALVCQYMAFEARFTGFEYRPNLKYCLLFQMAATTPFQYVPSGAGNIIGRCAARPPAAGTIMAPPAGTCSIAKGVSPTSGTGTGYVYSGTDHYVNSAIACQGLTRNHAAFHYRAAEQFCVYYSKVPAGGAQYVVGSANDPRGAHHILVRVGASLDHIFAQYSLLHALSSTREQWTIVKLANGKYNLVNDAGNFLSARGGGTTLSVTTASYWEEFTITRVSDGIVQIRTHHNTILNSSGIGTVEHGGSTDTNAQWAVTSYNTAVGTMDGEGALIAAAIFFTILTAGTASVGTWSAAASAAGIFQNALAISSQLLALGAADNSMKTLVDNMVLYSYLF
eukprot:13561-Heterococcus_DN1.PRE.4